MHLPIKVVPVKCELEDKDVLDWLLNSHSSLVSNTDKLAFIFSFIAGTEMFKILWGLMLAAFTNASKEILLDKNIW